MMSVLKYRVGVGLMFVLLGLLSASTAFAGPRTEYTKTLKREFSTTADGKVELSNKYGKIRVNTWAENKVKIEVTIMVNAKNETEAEQGFERISVNFLNMVGHVKAETVIQEQQSSSWWGWSAKGNSCQDFSINYMVWMPESNDLNLTNKYGDSDIASLDGRLIADIKYGNLNTDDLEKDAKVTLGYGKARMRKVHNLDAKLSYGELSVKDSKSVNLDSKYSELAIDNAERLVWDSRYDDFRIGDVAALRFNSKYSDGTFGNVGSLEIEADYTDIRVESLNKYLEADLGYSDLRINNLSPNFTKINLNSDYSDFYVGSAGGLSYSFDVEGSYTDMRFNSGAVFSIEDKSGTRKHYQGTVGSGGGIVKARMTYGEMTFR